MIINNPNAKESLIRVDKFWKGYKTSYTWIVHSYTSVVRKKKWNNSCEISIRIEKTGSVCCQTKNLLGNFRLNVKVSYRVLKGYVFPVDMELKQATLTYTFQKNNSFQNMVLWENGANILNILYYK